MRAERGDRQTRRSGLKGTTGRPPLQQPPSPIAVLQQFRELFRVSQAHFQRVEARCGLGGAQLWALSEVARRPGITISEIARALSIHLSTSSNLLDKLETQQLIRRQRQSKDQRLVHVHPT